MTKPGETKEKLSTARRPGAAASTASHDDAALRVIASPSRLVEENIVQSTDLSASDVPVTPHKVVANPVQREAEDILPSPATSNSPRLANGSKIVQNRAYQRTQKIRPTKLKAPVSDEMDYKKLFTEFEEAFSAQDIAAIGACLSPAFQWHLPNGKVIYGKKEALEEMDLRFAMPNGPKFSKSIWRFEGTTVLQSYHVEYLGPDGKWRHSKGFDLYEIGGGLITLKDAYWKMIP